MKRFTRIIAVAVPVLWASGCTNSTEPTTRLEAPTSANSTWFSGSNPFFTPVEFSGQFYWITPFPSYDKLPSQRILPDPFLQYSGWVDPSIISWPYRRAEIKASIEKYEIGPKPAPSDVVVDGDYRNDSLIVTVTRPSNGKSITLRTEVFLPADSLRGHGGPYPAMVGMAWFFGNGAGSMPLDIFTSRPIMRLNFYHDQSTLYFGTGTNDPYFQLYPEYAPAGGPMGQYSAWSWGVSRLIDGMIIAARKHDHPLPLDITRIGVTGCSYAGKMALYAGALDERVALTVAQESGGGGIPAWRISHAIEPDGTVEKTDNTNGQWFMQSMKDQFRGDSVYKMPTDHHELAAMVAPRGLLVTGNTDFVWLSNRSAYITSRAVEETYKTLGVPDNFGFYIDGAHNHCAVPDAQKPAMAAFVDKFLLGKLSANTHVRVTPFPDLPYQQWMPWSLRNDINALVASWKLPAFSGLGLNASLNLAMSTLAKGQTNAAIFQLDGFISQVRGLMLWRTISSAQGNAMITRVEDAKKQILGTYPAI